MRIILDDWIEAVAGFRFTEPARAVFRMACLKHQTSFKLLIGEWTSS